MPFKSHSQNSISSSWENSEWFKIITSERFIHLLGIHQLLYLAESKKLIFTEYPTGFLAEILWDMSHLKKQWSMVNLCLS